MNTSGNREQWLQQAVIAMTPLFESHGYTIPDVRVSCGFPSRSGLATRNRRIGECWSTESATDARSQIFISPTLESADSVLATLVHEVVHAVVGLKAKHGKMFKQCAVAVGLTGKMTATIATDELKETFKRWSLGDYPHAALSSMSRAKQSTRLVKCQCGECGYVIRTTAKWLEQSGAPICPCNEHPMDVAP